MQSILRALRPRPLALSLALLAVATAGIRADRQVRALDSAGHGEFELSLAGGGSLRGELQLEDGQAAFLLQGAIFSVQANEEQPGALLAQVDGVLLDAQSLAPVARFDGPMVLDGGYGALTAIVHPIAGPDPHKVDIGVLQARLESSSAGAAASSLVMDGRAAYALALDEEL